MSHANVRKSNSREQKKPKGAMHKVKDETEYQRTRRQAKERKHKRGGSFFD